MYRLSTIYAEKCQSVLASYDAVRFVMCLCVGYRSFCKSNPVFGGGQLFVRRCKLMGSLRFPSSCPPYQLGGAYPRLVASTTVNRPCLSVELIHLSFSGLGVR
eukprot:6177871-Pleurochrysis_carterae.AAC.2